MFNEKAFERFMLDQEDVHTGVQGSTLLDGGIVWIKMCHFTVSCMDNALATRNVFGSKPTPFWPSQERAWVIRSTDNGMEI